MFEAVPSIQSSHCGRTVIYCSRTVIYCGRTDVYCGQTDIYIYIAIGWLYNLISINIFTTWLPYILHINKHISNYQ